MILLIDNYDSFSYNLYQLIGTVNQNLKVIRNDEMTVAEIEALDPELIVLSPGPGKPSDAGVCIQVVKELGEKIPIFGVCLGHQAICEAYGATVSYAKELMHGKTSMAKLDTSAKLFQNMEPEIQVARYHSLAVVPETILCKTSPGGCCNLGYPEGISCEIPAGGACNAGYPEGISYKTSPGRCCITECPEGASSQLKVTAVAEDGEIMAVEHRKYPVYGVQFHPESVLTPDGIKIIKNLLK